MSDAPCVRFFGQGGCEFGDKCWYSHTNAPAAKAKAKAASAPKKAAAKAKGTAAIVQAGVASSALFTPTAEGVSVHATAAADSAKTNEWQKSTLLRTRGWMPRIIASLATIASPFEQPFDPSLLQVEWIDDTGAGRHLGSLKYYDKHLGISKHDLLPYTHQPSELVNFSTGGGERGAECALTFSSDNWGECEQHLLPDCPDLRSSGLLVEELQRPRIHWPGQLPYYIRDVTKAKITCAESNKIYADRMEENAPIFIDKVKLHTVSGAMPAAVERESGPPPPDPANQGGEEEPDLVVPPPPELPEGIERESRIERLKREATSPAHLISHFPKNPYCAWCERGRMTSGRVCRKPANPDIVPDEPLPTDFGQKTSTDTYIISKSASDEKKIGGSGEHCVQTMRDACSGLFMAYPLAHKTTEWIKWALQQFIPRLHPEVQW